MNRMLNEKSTVDEIRQRFDSDVERFSNFDTGQISTIDAPLSMALITEAAYSTSLPINRMLDIGCGAGNNTLKLLQKNNQINCDLLDISLPMLNRARARVQEATQGEIRTFCGDFRTINLEPESYDVIFAAAVFHHLRDDDDWEVAFKKVYSILRTGGSIWITDLVTHDHLGVNQMMWNRYADYLTSVGGKEYCQKVFDYIDIEDSPRSVMYQIKLLEKVGFRCVEILHKNSNFAAFGAIK